MKSKKLLKCILLIALMILITPTSVIASEEGDLEQTSDSDVDPATDNNSDANFISIDLMIQAYGDAIDSSLSTDDLDWDSYVVIDQMTLEAGRIYQILIPCDRRESASAEGDIWWHFDFPRLLDPDTPTNYDYFAASVGWSNNAYTGQVEISSNNLIHLIGYHPMIDIYNADGKYYTSVSATNFSLDEDTYLLAAILDSDTLPDAEQYYIGVRVCSLDDAMLAELESTHTPSAKNSVDNNKTILSRSSTMTLVTIVSIIVSIGIILAVIHIRKY